jgi:hypothetical protein
LIRNKKFQLMGLKPPEPTVIYNPDDTTQSVANVAFDPSIGRWVDARTWVPLPDYQQAWRPKDQLITPTRRYQLADLGVNEKTGRKMFGMLDTNTGKIVGEPFEGGLSTPPKGPLAPEEIEREVRKTVQPLYDEQEKWFRNEMTSIKTWEADAIKSIRQDLATGKFDPTVYTGMKDHNDRPITTAKQYAEYQEYLVRRQAQEMARSAHVYHQNRIKQIGDLENSTRSQYQSAETGSQAPAEYGPAPRSVSVDQEQIRQMVRQRAQAYGIDPDLAEAIARQESGFAPNAVSSAGAKGVMQLMPETARNLGVRNIWDPQENIDAGLRYLKFLLTYYKGDTAKALAAYNAGPEAVNRAGGVPPIAETQRYVQSILSSVNKGKGGSGGRPPAPVVPGGSQGVLSAVPTGKRIPPEGELDYMFVK